MQRWREKTANLGFWDDLNSHMLTFPIALLEPGGASIPKMPTADLVADLQPARELLREPKPLIQLNAVLLLVAFLGNRRRRRSRSRLLALAPGEHGANVLRRRRRRERPAEEPARRGAGTAAPVGGGRRRGLLEVVGGAGAVEGKERRLLGGGDGVIMVVVRRDGREGFGGLGRVGGVVSGGERVWSGGLGSAGSHGG